jgi:hypothetical protein
MPTGRPPGRPKKVYDWDPYREIIYSLYVEQRRSLPVLQEYLATEHNFAPRYVYRRSGSAFGTPYFHLCQPRLKGILVPWQKK